MITYNGIIDYFREFADKHFQIHSFTEGTADKIDLKKINDYPVLHIDITGTDIQDKMLVFNLDVYIITSAQSDDEAQRVNALSSMLMIMQDLRAEFFEGKYVVPKLLMLRGSEELSCTPIQENFNNRVYGWSTSMSVTGINEATRCTIPYPTYNNVMEQWIGNEWQKPFDSNFFGSFYWWSANTQIQDKIQYASDGVNTITSLKNHNWLSSNDLTSNYASQTDKIRYIEDEQAFRFKGSGSPYWLTNIIATHTERYYYFAMKVKNIKSLDAEDTSLFQIHSSGQADGIRVSIGSPFIRNEILGDELVVDGGWAPHQGTTNWSIDNINNTFTSDGGTGSIKNSGSSNVSVGKYYKATYEILDANAGKVKLFSGSGQDATPLETEVGVHSHIFQSLSNSIYLYSNGFNGSVGNVSFKEVIQFANDTPANKIKLSNWDNSIKESPVNISDGSNDYIREESLTFGLEIGGDDKSSVVKLVLDGEVVSTLTIPTGELESIIIGNNQTGSLATASFDLEEFYAYKHNGMSEHLADFIKVTDWLKYR